ncbi:MAG: hypothetical protein JST31_00585 [Actinobacteria bacterium]|nr:hypothetical protein [Actinomycetota bacterium]
MVYDEAGHWVSPASASGSNGSGSGLYYDYQAGPLVPGNYYVCAGPITEGNSQGYYPQCWNGQTHGTPSLAGAAAVSSQEASVPWTAEGAPDFEMQAGGVFAGTVTDAATGQVLPEEGFATVTLPGAPPKWACGAQGKTLSCPFQSYSDPSTGHYQLGGGASILAPGGYTIEFAAPGYVTKDVTATITAGTTSATTTTVNVALQPAGSGAGTGTTPTPPTPPPAGGAGPGSGGPQGVSAAQLLAALKLGIVPSGKGAAIAALLQAGGYASTFKALTAGEATVAWYGAPAGALGSAAKSHGVLVGHGSLEFGAAGAKRLRIALTAAGRKLLKSSKRVKIEISATFSPTGGSAVSTALAFVLKR